MKEEAQKPRPFRAGSSHQWKTLAARCREAVTGDGNDALDSDIAEALYPEVVNYDPQMWLIRHGGISQDYLCREYALGLAAAYFDARAELAKED